MASPATAPAITFPTAADQAANGGTEVYGLRTTLVAADGGSYAAPDLFLHGRDYYCPMPASPNMTSGQDNAQFVRVYRLRADNVYSGSTWTGRTAWCSAERLMLFQASLVGYPYVLSVGGTPTLFRHLPEPFLGGNSSLGGNPGMAYVWIDTRTGSSIYRYWMHASRVVSVRGIGNEGQSPTGSAVPWTPNTQSILFAAGTEAAIIPPDEAYPEYEVSVMFERLPYNVMLQTDAAFAGEFSRFVIYQEEPQGRALQTRLGTAWDTNAGYGQPASPLSGAVSVTEGVPIFIGQNNIIWKWVDVPYGGIFWDGTYTVSGINYTWGVTAQFGKINDTDFCTTTTAPFRKYTKESLLFRTAFRSPDKPSCIGAPLNDYTFYLEHAPGFDGAGYWNRLINKSLALQRYVATGATAPDNNYYKTMNFVNLFKTTFASPTTFPPLSDFPT